MIKFCVKGDNGANPFFSSSIIINNLNEGAKKAGLYDEKGKIVVYSTTCDDYGHNPDVFMCVYETALPMPILQHARGRPIIGCSLDNLFFITDTYPSNLAGYSPLGVDTEIFKPQPRTENKEVFRFLCFAESNVRSGLDIVIKAFCQTFGSQAELYIKDRGATEEFKKWLKEVSYGSNVIHDTENTQNFEDIKKIYAESDVQINVSRSSTWNMPCLEGMAMGLPLIGNGYSGQNEYLRNVFNGWTTNYSIQTMKNERIEYLKKLGFRHHMFPVENHTSKPYWAETDEYSLKEIMIAVSKLSKEHLNIVSQNAINTAQYFTWSRAAVNLSLTLEQIEYSKDKNLSFRRYD